MSDPVQHPPALGALPPTDVLAEATPQSLSELFSRDPEGYSDQDLATVVAALRAQRAKFKSADTGTKATGQVKAPKAKVSLSAPVGPIDAGSVFDD